MSKGIRILVPTIFLLALTAANVWLWGIDPPGDTSPRRVTLDHPFQQHRGYAYKAEVPVDLISDDPSYRAASFVQLLENTTRLGPAHSMHEQIAEKGAGRFSHWGQWIYFAASDNTDPNANGRSYEIRYPATLPTALYLGLLLVSYLVVVFLVDRAFERLPLRWARVLPLLRAGCIVLFTVHLVQACFWVITENLVARQTQIVQQWYRYTFHDESGGISPGKSINYVEHPYLNYAVNAAMPYGGSRQFNKDYRIRRSESILPRDKARWRMLALGGSTTFGEGLAREQDTWVFQLEQRVRAQCGASCEVINGGVGGYTVLENFIHYVALLTNLEPDVVLFYEGINDVWPRLVGKIQSDYSNYRVPWRSNGSVIPSPRPALADLYAYRYYFLKRHILRTVNLGIQGVTSRAPPDYSEWAAALDRNGPEVYRVHLQNLVHLVQRQGRRVVILPQHFVVKEERDNAFVLGVEEHNDVNREVAVRAGVPFVEEILRPDTFEYDDTGDNCHFNRQGSLKMAEVVFKSLKAHRLFPITRVDP